MEVLQLLNDYSDSAALVFGLWGAALSTIIAVCQGISALNKRPQLSLAETEEIIRGRRPLRTAS